MSPRGLTTLRTSGTIERLERLVHAYAEICHRRARHGSREVDRLVHSPFELDAAEASLSDLCARAIQEAGASTGGLTPRALAAYSVSALAAAADVPRSKVAAVAHLVVDSLIAD